MRTMACLAVTALLASGCADRPRAAAQSTEAATAEIRAAIDRYVASVRDADERAIRELLAQPDDVSYVTPMQRLRSWSDLQGFWGFLRNAFTRRELTLTNVTIRPVGDLAVAVFDWEFNGTQADGKPSQSHGWETQVYQRTPAGWRLRHGHYSAALPPPPGGAPTAP